MPVYRVKWELDVEADTAQEAAERAMMEEVFGYATISMHFTVTDRDSGEITPCSVTPPLLY